jgi:uncharacterized membrane protein
MQRLLAAGIVIILAGMLVLVISAAGQGQASVGGAIFIGPFPIAFGTGPSGTSLALVSVIIGAVLIGLTFLWVRGARTR